LLPLLLLLEPPPPQAASAAGTAKAPAPITVPRSIDRRESIGRLPIG
jgi:hypothetical protein